jgi:hypothetical protein
MEQAWHYPLNGANPCHRLDWLLYNTTRMLKSWSDKHIGSVRLQLEVAKEVVHRLELARDHRPLAGFEESLRQRIKLESFGLSSLQRSIVRQESRLLWLSEGDTPTRFFHYHAATRHHKNHIHSLSHGDSMTVTEDHKAEIAFSFSNNILGRPPVCSSTISLEHLDLPLLDLACLSECFTESEVWAVIRSLPLNKASGPVGFTACFLQRAWPIIRGDIMGVFYAFWSMDFRNLHDLNGALMVLLPKSPDIVGIKEYMSIALIHLIGKLIPNVLANHLASKLNNLVHCSKSAFIKGRCIQDSFRFVQGSTRLLHARKLPNLLLKIDIVRAFDSVAWPFLLEILLHAGFLSRWCHWISALLSSVSTKVLLNGEPGERICHTRRLHQGDPLSPMLFILVMEILSVLIRVTDSRSLLQSLQIRAIKHCTSLYADDLIVFLWLVARDL